MAKFCKKCGNQLNDNAIFCTKCGTRFEAQPAPQQPVQPTAQPATQTAVPVQQPEAPKKKKSPVKAIIAVVLAIAVLAGGGFAAWKFGLLPHGDKALSDENVTATSAYLAGKKVGDIIEFGSYPQTKVTDEATISALESMQKNWISYEYYSGTGDRTDGNMKPSDYMKYADVTYNGDKYRAVTFTSYRPFVTGYEATEPNSYQYDNGYTTGNVYYFRYEPLQWRVLDPATGYVMCDIAIDAQAYNNFIVKNESDGEYYGDSAQSYYASDWENCSLRKWLNEDFYNTAFTSSEQSKISTTSLSNKSILDSKYDSAETSDKIFLLSRDDVLNSSYGFSSDTYDNDTARMLKSTDYAKCQGCFSSTNADYLGNSWWRLRSPDGSYYAAFVYDGGYANASDGVNSTDGGIVPAFKFN